MRLRAGVHFVIALLGSGVRGDSSVPRAGVLDSGRAGRIAAVVLLVDPVRVASADRLDVGGQVQVAGSQAATARRSVVEVRDATGRVVFADSRAFLMRGEEVISLGLGFSSSAGPRLPATLPAGDYVAVWTLDGVRSNQARFTVGPGAPPPLSIERSADGRLFAHVYNPGPDGIDLPDALEGSTLIVDGKPYPRQGVEWNGSSTLPTGRGWGTILHGASYGAPAARHTVGLQLAGWRSNTLTW